MKYKIGWSSGCGLKEIKFPLYLFPLLFYAFLKILFMFFYIYYMNNA